MNARINIRTIMEFWKLFPLRESSKLFAKVILQRLGPPDK
jgi:hypothetical protein